MRIEFEVESRPPKKHGEKSMWARDDEAPYIALLRKSAVRARDKAGLRDCFRCHVKLELTVYIPGSRLESAGDLDNFITGVFDSLQAADPKVMKWLHQVFREPENEDIDPRIPLLIDNDSRIVSVLARKVLIDEGQPMYYTVALEPA